MKKINLFGLFLSCFLLVGCGSTDNGGGGGQPSGGHTHVAADKTYLHDETWHWQICKDCGEVFNKEKHVWDGEREHTTQPTCTKEGEHVVTKKCNTCGETQEIKETLDKLDHDYIAKYTWSDDHLSCTANYVCRSCGDISATETVSANLSEHPATLSGDGWYSYEAIFTNPVFSRQTYVETIPQLSFEFELNADAESYTLKNISSENRGKNTFTIPSEYKGLPVTKIGSYAFSGAAVKYVSIPDSVTEIEEYAFRNCTSLTDIFLSRNIEIVDSSAFEGCDSLSLAQVSTGLYYLNSNASGGSPEPICLLKVDENVTNVTIDYRCRVIASRAFYNCSSLTKVYGGESLVGIGDYAFMCCEQLATITIPNTIKHIGLSAFSGCISLAYTTYQNGEYLGNTSNPYLCLMNCIDSHADTAVIHESCKHIFYFCIQKAESLEIPEGVQSIGPRAFSYAWFKSITLPSTLSSIGECAFDGSHIKSITIPSGVSYLPGSAFRYCQSLESVVLPDSLKGIGNYVFNNCAKLASINTPNDLVYFGEGAFYQCRSLTSYHFSQNISVVPRDSFNNCIALSEIILPEGVNTIEYMAFAYCEALRNVSFPSSLRYIRGLAFYGCKAMTEVAIPKGLLEINFRAFAHCTSLQAFTVESGSRNYASKDGVLYNIANMGESDPSVMVDGVNLSEIYLFPSGRTGSYVIPDHVRGLATLSFCGSLLSEITISNKITWLPSEVFYECKNLKDVNYTGTKAKWNELVEYSQWFEWGQIPDEEKFDITVHCSDGDIVVPKSNGQDE